MKLIIKISEFERTMFWQDSDKDSAFDKYVKWKMNGCGEKGYLNMENVAELNETVGCLQESEVVNWKLFKTAFPEAFEDEYEIQLGLLPDPEKIKLEWQ